LIHGTIYQIDTNGNVLMEFKGPSNKPSGLAWVDGYLFYAEVHGAESYGGLIYKVDPDDGSVLDSFDSPGNWSEGLGYDGENLLLVSSVGASFYKINPDTGAVVEEKKTSVRSPTGVTWDGKNIWICSPTEDVIKKL
jgi:outer membrane protein assembly factor BamB